jgi:uncharacterized protein (TIGR00730 family)
VKITVFGGSSPVPGDPAYEQAYQLGKLIGGAGFNVLTGGYIGTMEAVSRGVNESGGRVIGVTCDQIEAWRPVSPNPWVQDQMRFATLQERLYALIENCDAALALPGGIGTLAEVAVMWSQLQTRSISTRPLILIGSGWRSVYNQLINQFEGYIPPEHRQFITFAAGVQEAFNMLVSYIDLSSG